MLIANLEYYKKGNGKIPVQEFLMSLPTKLRAKAFRDIELLNIHGGDLREPYVQAIKGKKYKGIYELRIKFANDIARIFYFICCENTFILLHGFLKKKQLTPRKELEIALTYKEDYVRRREHGED